ncbi:hypothetical protein PV11_07823 [Exophiala sideris]|uniref:GRAM domain-containing protein n=1 Tax=Exophiala sideris TaxID=1016849 RepID=A0A0D1YBB7_9EURO|nr:hypothetical protein PV11_07823 [Exophiala sideris]
MASAINHFGAASDGLDRAQLDVAPPVDAPTDPRPPAEALNYRKPSIRRVVKDNLLSVVVHPRYGVNKIKAAISEKREAIANETGEHQKDPDHAPTLAPAPPNRSLENDRLVHGLDEKPKFPPAKEFIKHPMTSLQSTVQDQRGSDWAENMASSEVSHGAEVNLVRQADKVANAVTPSEKEDELRTLVQLKQSRQDEMVRWSIDRHVRRVARTHVPERPPQPPPLSKKDPLQTWSEYTKARLKYELHKRAEFYIDNASDLPQPDRKLLASALERLIIASVPVQNAFMRLRNISHWVNPRESAGYMVLYFSLLVFSQITRMIILFVLLGTLYRRWHPPTLSERRKTLAHSEDRDAIAQDLVELVTQYGTRGWVDHSIDLAGPVLFDSMERAADILETLRNFYEWRVPWRTGCTLGLLFAWWSLITLAPTWLLVQMTFSFVGIDFFILTPLGVRNPQYRLLVSPWTWLLWKIPTHADWAIARLQAEAEKYLEQHGKLGDIDNDDARNTMMPSKTGIRDTPEGPQMIGRYKCRAGDVYGDLVVTTASISFSPKKSADHTGWLLPFRQLTGLQKVTVEVKSGEEAGLIFVELDGSKHNIAHMNERDLVFSQIIGYSRLLWKRTG